jgi:predicted permease
VLAFTLLISVVTGLVFGCIPALQASKGDLIESMKTSTRGTSLTPRRHRFRSGLVVVQVALAVVLLVGAGLVVASFVRLRTNDLGADPRGALGFTVPFQGARYTQTAGPYRGLNLIQISPLVADSVTRIWTDVRGLPGVQAVAGSSAAPFTGARPFLTFTIAGRARGASEAEREASGAAYQVVTPGYFAILRIPIARGRDFDSRDAFNTPWGVVINEAMARQFWPDMNPVGQRLTLDLVPDEQPREVIGVARDARSSPYEQAVQPTMYALYTQQAPHTLGPIGTPARNTMTFIVRPSGASGSAITAIRRVLTELDRDRPMVEIRPLEDNLAEATAGHQYAASLFGLFSLIAVFLATTGIYGIVSHGVVQRAREIGIRMALGAGRSTIRWLIVREVALLTAIGIALGMGTAALLTGSIRGWLFGVTATDPLTYVLVAFVMTLAVVLAAWLPSQRASGLAPTVALRSD